MVMIIKIITQRKQYLPITFPPKCWNFGGKNFKVKDDFLPKLNLDVKSVVTGVFK